MTCVTIRRSLLALDNWMLRLAPRLSHMCIIVEANFVMRAVARFVAYSMNITHLSFHQTEADAIDAARRLRG